MDLLKYVDVLIGLALVMLLLSPLVTAFTQFVMWVVRSRPSALRAGLRDLLLQLGGSSTAAFKAATITATSKPDAAFTLTGFEPGTLAAGTATTRTATGAATAGTPVLQLRTNGAAATDVPVTVTLERREPEAHTVTGETAAGTVSLSYNCPTTGFESTSATITVRAAGVPVDATVKWTIASGPDKGQNGVAAVTAAKPGAFTYPGTPPSSYVIELVATDAAQTPLDAHAIEMAFARSAAFDVSVAGNTDATGSFVVFDAKTAMPGLTEPEALQVADAVLLHPMIAMPGTKLWKWPLLGKKYVMGSVVEREELIRILLELAANEGTAAANLKDQHVARTLGAILHRNGIPFPGRTLAAIRDRAQQLEHDEPGTKAHERQTKAIIEASRSDFVGKINNWFDQAMTRVIARYALWARLVTVAGAFAVAMTMQVDSIDLLKRLSADDELRNSLVAEASAQEARLDRMYGTAPSGSAPSDTASNAGEPAANAAAGAGASTAAAGSDNPDAARETEIAAAKELRDDIRANLATLRSPQLAILPDHLFWQRLPRARLVRNELWKQPFPAELQLVLGTSLYPVKPERWRGDPLEVLRAAIAASGAPVDLVIEPSTDQELIVTGNGEALRLGPDSEPRVNLLRGDAESARVIISADSVPALTAAEAGQPRRWEVLVGQQSTYVEFTADTAAVFANFTAQVPKDARFDARVDDTWLVLTAKVPDADWIVVRTTPGDPATDLTSTQTYVARRWRVLQSQLAAATARLESTDFLDLTSDVRTVTLCRGQDCATLDLDTMQRTIVGASSISATDRLSAVVRKPDALVINSQRLGAIELRHAPGDSKTNILNRQLDTYRRPWTLPATHTWRGLFLTWALLSLGAPFWYDVFKDLLKLRPAMAKTEAQQRTARQTDTKPSEAAKKKL